MAIVVTLDEMLHLRRMTLTELSTRVGITLANLSILKTGKARGLRFQTLAAICAALDKEGLSLEEFFGDLRTHHVEHLGQVKAAHVEVDGDLSVFFQADEDVLPGLPIHVGWAQELRPVALWPDGPLSCGSCGVRRETAPIGKCANCGSDGWLPSVSFKRIS